MKKIAAPAFIALVALCVPAIAVGPLRRGDVLSSQFNEGVIYRVASTTGSAPEPWANVMRGITGLAQLPSGDIAVASSRQHEIVRVDSMTGAPRAVIFDTAIDNPRGLATDRSGTLWVSALNNGQVVAIDPTTGTEVHRLSIERAFAIAAFEDTIYVTGQYDGSLHKISAVTGDYLGVIATELGPNLEEMAVSRNGDLLIGDSFIGMLRVDSTTGEILARAPEFTPGPMAIDLDGSVISKNIDGRLVRLDPLTLTEVGTIATDWPPQHGMMVYTLPEPNTLLLTFAGVVGLVLWQRLA